MCLETQLPTHTTPQVVCVQARHRKPASLAPDTKTRPGMLGSTIAPSAALQRMRAPPDRHAKLQCCEYCSCDPGILSLRHQVPALLSLLVSNPHNRRWLPRCSLLGREKRQPFAHRLQKQFPPRFGATRSLLFDSLSCTQQIPWTRRGAHRQCRPGSPWLGRTSRGTAKDDDANRRSAYPAPAHLPFGALAIQGGWGCAAPDVAAQCLKCSPPKPLRQSEYMLNCIELVDKPEARFDCRFRHPRRWD